MYSVLRVTGQPDIHPELAALVSSINAARPQMANDRRRGDGFTVHISSSEVWNEHLRSLTSFVSSFVDQIAKANLLGASVTFDVAIEPEDRDVGHRLHHAVRFGPELLTLLSTVGVGIEVTSYP